jgi:hypothetical protein
MNHLHTYFTECPFAITPTGEPHELRLTVNTVEENSRLQTISGNNQAADAAIITKSTNESLNNSVCGISSLEVYRGREKAIEVNHTGFVLGNFDTFEVNNY